MSAGTSAGLLDQRHSQSVFKHAILDTYIIPFAEMTGSKSEDHRVVLVDGFAGRGTYPDGTLASAGLLLKAASAVRRARVEVHLVEKQAQDYRELDALAAQHRARGITAPTYKGRVDKHLPAIIDAAKGLPLFLFLDPCGANLPFETLKTVMTRQRFHKWPPTELLLNFSADLTRRTTGAVLAAGDSQTVKSPLDAVCGGTWWRDLAFDHAGDQTFEPVAEAIAEQYAARLGRVTGMKAVTVPVRRHTTHQPVYHLIFLTRSPYGIWVFAEAIAKARRAWLKSMRPAEAEGTALLTFDEVIDAGILDAEYSRSIRVVEGNIRSLLTANRGRIKLVDHVAGVFAGVLGEADDQAVIAALKQLENNGEINPSDKGVRLRDRIITSKT